MSNEETSYRAYWDSVDSLADEVVQRVEEEGADEGDALHEAVDGSWWIIYTHAARAVMEHTRNDDYGVENGLIESSGEWNSFADVVTAFAFWAMYGDVLERLEDARERWELNKPEEEEETDGKGGGA